MEEGWGNREEKGKEVKKRKRKSQGEKKGGRKEGLRERKGNRLIDIDRDSQRQETTMQVSKQTNKHLIRQTQASHTLIDLMQQSIEISKCKPSE